MDDYITIEIPWQPPQRIHVKTCGEVFITSLIDRYGRSYFYEGKNVGYNVTLFKCRVYQSVSEIIVQGRWSSAIYRDHGGKYHAVIIHGAKKEKSGD